MVDVITTAKRLTQPTVGADNNTWGGVLNTDLSIIDNALGGTLTKVITGTSTTITGSDTQNSGYIFTGTLAILNTIGWSAFFGFASITNNTTGGFNIACGIVSSGGAYATILNGESAIVWSDGVNFVRLSQPIYPGFMQTIAVAVPPSGWLNCDGSAVSRTTYAALWNTIGPTFGAGNGSTTFNLPDMRGRVAAGWDSGNATGRLTASVAGGVSAASVGDTGGVQDNTLTSAQMPSHAHGVTDGTHTHTYIDGTHAHTYSDPGHVHSTANQYLYQSGANANMNFSGGNSVGGDNTVTSSPSNITILGATSNLTIQNASANISIQSTGGGAAHNNAPPTLIVNWIVKT